MMITKRTLDHLRKLQMNKYIDGSSRLLHPPQDMFINGEFNGYERSEEGIRLPINSNSGDNLIQNLNDKHNYSGIMSFVDKLSNKRSEYKYSLIVNRTTFEGETYLSIIIDGLLLGFSCNNRFSLDMYYFSWFENRGTITDAKLNSDSITEDQYIWLLNIIEDSGCDLIKSRVHRHLSK